MCCDDVKVSEDIRVIYNELEKANTWVFAAQEILRPEKEEFDPDLKDLGNIEVAISFAIASLKEAATLCQIYRASVEVPAQKRYTEEYSKPENYMQSKPSAEKLKILNKFRQALDVHGAPIDFSAINLRETQEALEDLEKKLAFLKANMKQPVKLTPEELKLYKDK